MDFNEKKKMMTTTTTTMTVATVTSTLSGMSQKGAARARGDDEEVKEERHETDVGVVSSPPHGVVTFSTMLHAFWSVDHYPNWLLRQSETQLDQVCFFGFQSIQWCLRGSLLNWFYL